MKNRLMTRVFSVTLCFVLLLGLIPTSFSAAETSVTTQKKESVIEQYEKSFQNNYYQLLTYEDQYAYKQLEETVNKKFLKGFAWFSLWVTDNDLDKDAYVKDLTTLLRMLETSFVENSEVQAEYKKKENAFMDLASSGQKISAELLFGDRFEAVKEAYDWFAFGYGFVDTFQKRSTTEDEISFLVATSVIHDKQITFLEAVKNNTSNKKLKSAAEDVIKICNAQIAYAINGLYLDGLKDATVKGIKDALDVYWTKITAPMATILKAAGSGMTKFCGHLLANANLFSVGWTIGVEAMKLYAGDELGCIRESISMDHISDALIAEFKNVKSAADSESDTSKKYEKIVDYVTLGEAITLTHLRGEYCYYNSCFDAKDSEAAKKHYDELDMTLLQISDKLTSILEDPLVVHENFKLYDGFVLPIEKKTTVPEGYIGIYTAEDFYNIYLNSPKEGDEPKYNRVNTAKYILMNDIVLSSQLETTYYFGGVLDGNGYTIRNITKPLFETANAHFVNLGVEANISMDAHGLKEQYFGTIVGKAHSDTHFNNCSASGYISIEFGGYTGAFSGQGGQFMNCCSSTNISVAYGVAIGGMSGVLDWNTYSSGSAYNCYNLGNITVISDKDSMLYVGGIFGWAMGETVEYCYNAGKISATGRDRYLAGSSVGGIVGRTSDDLKYCYNSGDVTAKLQKVYDDDAPGTARAGGIAGYSDAKVENCANTGSIYGDSSAAGITAYARAGVENCYNAGTIKGLLYSGGIVAYVEQGTIKTCYNSGFISGDSLVGAIFGEWNEYRSGIKNCYYLKQDYLYPSGQASKEFSTVKSFTEAEMKQPASFESFDFQKVWKTESDKMPTLRFKSNEK